MSSSVANRLPCIGSLILGMRSKSQGKNRDNRSRRENDEPDEGNDQTNSGICSCMLGLKNLLVFKYPTCPRVTTGSADHCASELVVHARWCTSTLFDYDKLVVFSPVESGYEKKSDDGFNELP
ncbi:hypothetical protein TNCV_1578161 [Trichonephila clavipes]|nr:hypothetical protein TNCV_1578161 [Trichonephila clavipes]